MTHEQLEPKALAALLISREIDPSPARAPIASELAWAQRNAIEAFP